VRFVEWRDHWWGGTWSSNHHV